MLFLHIEVSGVSLLIYMFMMYIACFPGKNGCMNWFSACLQK